MTVLPERCPICEGWTTWNPLRGWCINCGFTMGAGKGEMQEALIGRWNAAVIEGIGYAELERENNARAFAKQLQGNAFGVRNTELNTY